MRQRFKLTYRVLFERVSCNHSTGILVLFYHLNLRGEGDLTAESLGVGSKGAAKAVFQATSVGLTDDGQFTSGAIKNICNI